MPNGEPQPGKTPAVEGTPVSQRTPINSLGESETPRGLRELGYTQEEIRLFFAARQLPKGISGDPDEARRSIKDFLTQRGVAIPEDDKLEEVIVEMLANPQNYPILSSTIAPEVRPPGTSGTVSDEDLGIGLTSEGAIPPSETPSGVQAPPEEQAPVEDEETRLRREAFEELGLTPEGLPPPEESVVEEAQVGEIPPAVAPEVRLEEAPEEAPPPLTVPEEVIPPPGEEAISPERRSLAKGIWRALSIGAKNWVKNLDPRGKDKVWVTGVTVGAIESVAFIWAAPIPGMTGLIKAGLNLAAAQGVYGIGRGVHALGERQIKAHYTGDELEQKLGEFERNHASGMARMRNFFLGVSAGATYVSATGLGVEIAKGVVAGMQISSGLPSAPPAPPGEVPPISPEVQEALKNISSNPDYGLQKAASVGHELARINDVVKSALEQQGMSLSNVDPVTLENARLAVQHALEAQANTSFDSSLDALASTNPQGVGINEVVAAGRQSFENWLGQETTSAHLADVARRAITAQLHIEDALASQVSEALGIQAHSFADMPIPSGTTVGQILQEAGHGLTWGGGDAELLGAHIAANYDMLTDMWAKMAENHPNLVPDSPFPASLSELSDLISKAKQGDEAAMQKLIEALHWIPAGEKFRILTQVGISKTLEVLRR